MQEIAFLSIRKSKIFWGSMPPDLPPSQKCLGQSKILVTRLTVPVTFASAEGRFSKLKLLKTVMRSVMNQERLGELLTLACERDLTDMHDRSRRNANPWSKLTKRGHSIKIRCLTANCTYILAKFLINDMNFHALCSILLQHTNSPRVGLDSHFSGGSVSFRDYTPLVKINMYAPGYMLYG